MLLEPQVHLSVFKRCLGIFNVQKKKKIKLILQCGGPHVDVMLVTSVFPLLNPLTLLLGCVTGNNF